MYVGMSQIACERDDLRCRHRAPAAQPASSASTPGCRRTRTAGGSRWPGSAKPEATWTARSTLLDEAQRVYAGDFSPNVRPVPALRARVLAAHGRVGEALGWAREQGLSVDDDLSYLREYEHVTLARVLLAQHTGAAAATAPSPR